MILFAVPFFLLLIGIEIFISWKQKKKYYDFADAITSLNIGIGQQVVGVFQRGVVIWISKIVYDNYRLIDLPDTTWTFLLALIAFDFIFYWAHRWSHVNNFWWASHVVHHQSEHYNLSTALRQPWFHNLTAFFLFLPLPLLGISPLIFLPAAGINTLYQFWIHTETIGKLGPFEWVFNTPSHHRVHHGVNPKYLDKNYGGMFIIWDLIFGTFQLEEDKVLYGITTRFKSYNPIWANFHIWTDLVKQSFSLRRITDKLTVFFRRPGWKLGISKAELLHPDVHPETWKPVISPMKKEMAPYILVQLMLNIAGLSAFLFNAQQLSLFYRIFFATLILLSIFICGELLERKSVWYIAEYFRLALVFFALISCYWFWYPEWFLITLVLSGILFVGCGFWFTFTLVKNRNDEIMIAD